MLKMLIEALQSEDVPVFADSILKSKLIKVSNDIAKDVFSDKYWKPINEIQKAVSKVLPTLALYNSEYDYKNRPPQYKDWSMVGGFVNKEGKKRAAWVHIRASGAGSVDDPMDKYDVTVNVEILSPNNVENKAQSYLKNIGFID